jgi:Pretoxin HINT domain
MAAGQPFHLAPRARFVGSSLWRYAGSLLPGCILLIGLGWVLQLAAMRVLGGAGAWLGNALWAVCWSGYLGLARGAARGQRPRRGDALSPLSKPLSHLAFGLLATSGASLFGFGVLVTAAPLAFVPLYLGDGSSLGQGLRLSMGRALARPGRTALACLGLVAFNLLGSAALIGGLLVTIPLSALALAHAHEYPDGPRPVARRTSGRSRGSTLLEIVLCIALSCILVTSVARHYAAPLAQSTAAALRDRIAGTFDPQSRRGPRDPEFAGVDDFHRVPGAKSKLPQNQPPPPCTALGSCRDSNGLIHQPSTPDPAPSLFGRAGLALIDSASWVREQMRSLGQRVQAGVQALEEVIDEGQLRGRQQTEAWVRRVADVPVLGSLARGYAWAEDQQRQFGVGVLEGVVNLVGGGVQAVVDPVSTVEGVAALLTSPEARAAFVEGLVEPYKEAWAAGNYAEIPGRLAVDVGSIFYAGPRLSSELGQAGKLVRGRGPKCFGAGTPVLTPSGLQAIESIEVGDWVYARDPETGEVATKRVLATHVTPHRALVEVSVDGGAERLRATPGHPFWVEGSGWTAAADLAPGTPLSGLSPSAAAAGGRTLHELAADGVVALAGQHTVYNLTVEDFQTFFVGELGVWVHNTGPGKGCNNHAAERAAAEHGPGLAEGTLVSGMTNVQTIARGRQIHSDLDYLVKAYGGAPDVWVKKTGTGHVQLPPEDMGGIWRAEIHWYERIDTGQKFEGKVKKFEGYVGPSSP